MFVRLVLIVLVAVVAWAAIARPSGGAQRERTYVVRPGDTLWSIASRNYGGDPREGVWRLKDRNALRGAPLQPGQRLVVP